MKRRITVRPDAAGVDSASEAVGQWLEEAKEKRENIVRTRLAVEELLLRIGGHFGDTATAELCFRKGFGGGRVLIRYSGERFDPMDPPENELEEWSAEILASTGYVPLWRYRFKKTS